MKNGFPTWGPQVLQREAALEDLRIIIQKSLPYALFRWLSPDQPQFNSLVEEVTQGRSYVFSIS